MCGGGFLFGGCLHEVKVSQKSAALQEISGKSCDYGFCPECSNSRMPKLTEVAAWIGALTGPGALAWDFYKWKMAGLSVRRQIWRR
jgi:hypothetical protein